MAKILSLVFVLHLASSHVINKRGIPITGTNSQDQLSSNAYAQNAGNEAISQLRDQERVAEWSAANAVREAVGKDYSNQLATTANFVSKFTVPVTKEQAQNVFDTIRSFQGASKISAAVEGNSAAIWRAANNAASSNYMQALQSENAGYHRGIGSHYGSF